MFSLKPKGHRFDFGRGEQFFLVVICRDFPYIFSLPTPNPFWLFDMPLNAARPRNLQMSCNLDDRCG
jgi:hypothetical protein